jgi:hypothetical protein
MKVKYGGVLIILTGNEIAMAIGEIFWKRIL